jgi:hypothetical protein
MYTLSSRVDADEAVELIADVQDDETPIEQLTYQWSTDKGIGTFTAINGNPRDVRWQAPHGQKTPDAYVVTLTVTESYEENGESKQNKVSASTSVHYNDSRTELTNLGTDFIVNKFGNYSVGPAECVSNFSDSCPGKADELSDITANRQFFHILSATFSVDSIAFNADKTFATILGPCVFVDIVQTSRQKERVPGLCMLTGVYENWKWFLCASHTQPPGNVTTPISLLRYRAPGVR